MRQIWIGVKVAGGTVTFHQIEVKSYKLQS